MPTPNDPLADVETVTARINRVTFTNDETGWSVLSVTIDGETASAVGKMLNPEAGSAATLYGSWVQDARHGRQFEFFSYAPQLPRTAADAEAYLSKGRVKGIGPATAAAIVAHFGDDTLIILDTAIERLIEVPGIAQKRLDLITEGWAEAARMRAVEMALLRVGAPPHLAGAIWEVFGADGATMITTRPFDLTRVRGVGFLICDDIATSLGWDKRDPRRLSAGVAYALEESQKNGHCFLPRDKLGLEAANLLKVNPLICAEAIDQAVAEARLVVDEYGCYSPRLHVVESDLAVQIRRLVDADLDMPTTAQREKIDALVGKRGLTEQQQAAVLAVLSHAVTILTGGPGVGKSHTIKTIVEAAKVCRWKVLLCAPTGRAARRMSELADGHPASTVHRAIGYGVTDTSGDEDTDDDDDYLIEDLIVCDEASMLDVSLARHLTRAIATGARVLFVGDTDQLPSVGPGNVLGDLIASRIAPTIALNQIFRQGPDSGIVQVAHAVNAGKQPDYRAWNDLHLWATEDADAAAAYVEDMVCNRIPKKFKDDEHPILAPDIQVLTPKRGGSCGVNALNRRLQAQINPGSGEEYEAQIGGESVIFRPGDRAMIIKNNYSLGARGVFNGTPVKVTAVNPDPEDAEDPVVTVLTDEGETIGYDASLVRQLALAYAITIHKSQGSQYLCVVIPVTTQAWTMMVRNLIYTAITRAQKQVVLIGSHRALAKAIKTLDSAKRFTALAHRLRSL